MGVEKLKFDIELGYKESLVIDNIERSEITTKDQEKAGVRNFHWKVRGHSYAGRSNQIEFNAIGFKQVLTAQPRITEGSDLE